MATHDDLTAERAAIQRFYYSLNAGVDGGELQEQCEQDDIGRIIELVRKARQEALREAANTVARLIIDSQGQILDGDTILFIHDKLARLASEGG